MNDDIVTRLRGELVVRLNGEPWVTFDALPVLGEAADEIERLITDRDRWKAVALCVHCRPAAGNYCTDHYKSMNAPRPWGTPT